MMELRPFFHLDILWNIMRFNRLKIAVISLVRNYSILIVDESEHLSRKLTINRLDLNRSSLYIRLKLRGLRKMRNTIDILVVLFVLKVTISG